MVTPATKVTIIAENLLEQDILAVINEAGATGYTIVEGRGKGKYGLHGNRGTSVIDAFSIIRIEFVMRDRDTALHVAQTISERHFSQQPGIIYFSAVEVLRADRF